MFHIKSPLNKEWDKLIRTENKFLQLREQQKSSILTQMLNEKVPEKLQNTLEKGFVKAFELIFEKGTEIIEKTYKKEEMQKDFKINDYANEIKRSKKTIKAFGKKADKIRRVNLLISGATGVGMGILGVGIPDIPVFTSMILKSIYEIALSYGFEYDSEKERRFILMLILGAVSYGEEMVIINEQIDHYINTNSLPMGYIEKSLIERTASGLSKELLYMKFLQGIPIVGAVGGIYDAIYMKRITEYANIKYKKRFYLSKK